MVTWLFGNVLKFKGLCNLENQLLLTFTGDYLDTVCKVKSFVQNVRVQGLSSFENQEFTFVND